MYIQARKTYWFYQVGSKNYQQQFDFINITICIVSIIATLIKISNILNRGIEIVFQELTHPCDLERSFELTVLGYVVLWLRQGIKYIKDQW